jgi:hypothetical protein
MTKAVMTNGARRAGSSGGVPAALLDFRPALNAGYIDCPIFAK